MRSNTLYERVYDYISDNPTSSNSEIANDLNAEYRTVKEYILRLKNRGLIEVNYDEDGERVIKIIDELPAVKAKPKTYKQEVYYEMIETYRLDFKEASCFDDRLKVGREIRRILNDI